MRVFVYGTLKPGEVNFQRYCQGKVSEMTPAYTYGHLYALSVGYPAMTVGDTQVSGVLLTFPDDSVLADMDDLEDYDPHRPASENLYQRESVTLYTPSGESLGAAWGYRMTFWRVQQLGGVFLSSGCWRSR
ncbi:AIG2 family protein [Halothece sp. PCC 7418]|uniref:gamma-glutamylcyclotransferase family protein n=1 Tax=Halothece sp. (strain PCC 7418) TaxID=65093 RepID=UPI0002A07B98|nr:gamma-glutamylcyclotransferase family protein [Halothece sp. PCC 7418]AFZ43726.1 AIG2 family protein [Halothece sp. PCC 7418]